MTVRASGLERFGAVVVLLLLVLAGVVLPSVADGGVGAHVAHEAHEVSMPGSSGLPGGVGASAEPEIALLPLAHLAAEASLQDALVVCCALVVAAILVPVVSRWFLGRGRPGRVHGRAPAVTAPRARRDRGARPIVAHSLCVLRV
ncbi:hypothetical protein [Sanguibacter sp. 25GB23B1]|uniref:hypothetical protein n=1 Tax=unclassified Sanguibacter TaxID=2645534 RepID=UPI0032B015C2